MDNYDILWAFENFCEEIKSTNRHFLSEKALMFLDWLHTIALDEENNQVFKKDIDNVFRARKGVVYPEYLNSHEDNGEAIEYVDSAPSVPRGCTSDYLPVSSKGCSGGRASPEGVPFLYVATTPFIAVSEVRPFVNDEISVACMSSNRDLNIANFSDGTGSFFSFAKYDKTRKLANDLPKGKVIEMVVREVSNAFSRPISDQKKTIDYLPTQVIAEYFHSKGFDGIGFRSQFETCQYNKNRDDSIGEITVKKEGGYNVVFFNKDEFYVKSASVYRMKKTLNFIEFDQPSLINFNDKYILNIQKVRNSFHMNQDVFAFHIGADYRDLVNWEKGIGRPSDSQYKILKMLEERPEETMVMLKK